MKSLVHLLFALFPLLLIAADTSVESTKNAADAIDRDGLLDHMKVLSSDKFEGRGPGTRGEELSVEYVTAQFKKLGLKPGNPNGSFTQEIPMAGILSSPTATFTIGGKKMQPNSPKDFVAFTQRITPAVEVRHSDMVFVGYGIVAPEYGWDDFKGMDLKGKTLVFLINDPPLPEPQRSGKAR